MSVSSIRELELDQLNKMRYFEIARVKGGPEQDAPGDRRWKLVHVHGLWGSPNDSRRLLQLCLENGQYEVYAYRFRSRWVGGPKAEAICTDLTSKLMVLLDDPKARLVLVGHSVGGVIVRRAVTLLHRQRPEHLLRVERLVLLSSTNRGANAVSPLARLLQRIAMKTGVSPLVVDASRGSRWMTTLRIEWLEIFGGLSMRPNFMESEEGDVVTSAPEGAPVPRCPATVQIDGDRDRIVSPDDSNDLALFGESFHYWLVPGIGHTDFTLAGLLPGKPGAWSHENFQAREEDPGTKERSLELLAARIGQAVDMNTDPSSTDGGGGGPPRGPNPGWTPQFSIPPGGWVGVGGVPLALNVVLMIHGIRDYGGWHPLLQSELEHLLAVQPGFWRIVPIEYGYFSALQFLIPLQQDRVVRGFVDRYLNEVTRAIQIKRQLNVPVRVRIHIAAHSNGTNVLAQAITRDSGIYFTRVFLAGCVLRRDFWRKYDERAYAVRNDCATHDWPVGVLCRALGRLPLLGYWFLGPAGVDGFLPQDPRAKRKAFVHDNRWLTGDHGAALEPVRMKSIADFLIAGIALGAPINAKSPSKMRREKLLFASSLVVFVLLASWLVVKSGIAGVALALLIVLVIFVLLNL